MISRLPLFECFMAGLAVYQGYLTIDEVTVLVLCEIVSYKKAQNFLQLDTGTILIQCKTVIVYSRFSQS